MLPNKEIQHSVVALLKVFTAPLAVYHHLFKKPVPVTIHSSYIIDDVILRPRVGVTLLMFCHAHIQDKKRYMQTPLLQLCNGMTYVAVPIESMLL